MINVLVCLCCLLFRPAAAAASEIHVPGDFADPQAALASARPGDLIKVAAGRYRPVVMREGVTLQGGYSSDFLVRAPYVYETVIDGGGEGPAAVFENIGSAVIDGFTITNGDYTFGGGVRCYYSSPRISNNIITGNRAANGGGIYCYKSNPVIRANVIAGNSAEYGGGIMCRYSAPAVKNNLITGNEAGDGAGIMCSFSDPVLTNSILTGNTALYYGGALNLFKSSPALTNCTVAMNRTGRYGALFMIDSSPLITSTIFWDNDIDLLVDFDSRPAIVYSDISDPQTASHTGNISADPLFLDPKAGDFRLSPDSPCLDAGSPDIGLNDPDGSRNDMGAFGGPDPACAGAACRRSVSLPAAGDWQDMGLYGGKVTSLAVDPAAHDRIFACSYLGDGLFFTDNGGNEWRPLPGFMNSECRQVVIGPPDRVLVTYSYNIALSRDLGKTWSHRRLPDSRFANSVAVSDDAIYVGSGGVNAGGGPGTVFKSIDQGRTWRDLHPDLDKGVRFLALNPLDQREIWLLTGHDFEPGSVYKSVDGGDSWKRLATGYPYKNVNQIVIRPDDPAIAYLSGGFGLLKTTNGGRTWHHLEINDYCAAVALDPGNPDVLYTATYYAGDDNRLYKSEDGGNTWQTFSVDSRTFTTLVVVPDDSETLYGGDYKDGILKSVDGGRTWDPVNRGITANIVFDSTFDPADPEILLAGTGSGLFKRDADEEWRRLFNDPVYAVSYARRDSRQIAIGTDNAMATTSDYGTSWTRTTLSGGRPPYKVKSIVRDPFADNIIYLGVDLSSGDGGEIHKSMDGGRTFTRLARIGEPVNVVAVDPDTPRILYAGSGNFWGETAGREAGIYRSMDGGQTWSGALLARVVVNDIAVDPGPGRAIYAACGNSGGGFRGFYKSSDQGITWQNNEFTLSPVTGLEFDPGQPRTLYAATHRSGIFQSSDGGMTWLSIGLNDYVMQDLSLRPALAPLSKTSGCRLAATPYGGTDSGMQGPFAGLIFGAVSSVVDSTPVYPALLALDTGNGECSEIQNLSTGAYSISADRGDNYTLSCRARGFETGEITGIRVGAGSYQTCDFSLAPHPPAAPVADIRINGEDGPLSTAANDSVQLTVKFDAGDYGGGFAEWWLTLNAAAAGINGTYSYVPASGWVPGRKRARTAVMSDLPETGIRVGRLPPGSYEFEFSVEELVGGLPEHIYSDSAKLTIL